VAQRRLPGWLVPAVGYGLLVAAAVVVIWLALPGSVDGFEFSGAWANRIVGDPARAARFGELAKGFGVTLLVAVLSLGIGFVASIPVGVLLNRNKGIAKRIARGVVDFIRGTPALVQLFFVYFGLPPLMSTLAQVTGIPWLYIQLSATTAAVLTLSVNSAAYMSEVVRSGLMSVDPGQKLAGRALGFTKLQVFLLIIWPQAFRIAIPPLMNSVVALIKDTALISVITVPEVVKEAKDIINSTFEPTRMYFIVAVMFFVVTYPLMKLAGRLEAKMKAKGFSHD
jgi:His/Glu/Gln/Arg/opine family amino acid ABC transporter permease subunit